MALAPTADLLDVSTAVPDAPSKTRDKARALLGDLFAISIRNEGLLIGVILLLRLGLGVRMPCDSSCSAHCNLFRPLNLGIPSGGLVSSNDIPSDLQVAAISSAIEKTQTDLARVQDAIALLVTQRTELEGFIRMNEAVVSPLRRMPNEMLSEIFRLSSNVTAPFDPAHNHAWVVARVCRRWRSVAVTTSELWNHFILTPYAFDPTPVRMPHVPQRFWQTQLERAHNAPLTIRLARDITFFENQDFARFASLGIAFPLLRKLAVHDDMSFGRPVLPTDAPDADLVASLPALTHLGLTLGTEPFPPQLRLPWSQLRTCDFRSFRTSDIREILPLLSPGSHLTLRVPDVSEGAGGATPIVTRIQSLEIAGGSRQSRSELLSVLVAPRLQKLLIMHVEYEDTDPTLISTFLYRSGCKLRHLRVVGIAHPTRGLVDLLESPAVRGVIRLDVGHVHPDEWANLFEDFEERRLVPDLQTLVLRGNLRRVRTAQLLANRNPTFRKRQGPLSLWDWGFSEKQATAGRLDVVILEEIDTKQQRPLGW
ncbi:hypothetical protein FB45DRAFT_1032716 [Roridomyces roridus]|uniref:F-box domain-containing protein n=1 Tax=Roridomyces roridus TaxID=1738132 RepID=A0AAD7FJ11_9AGAR|nr:hypothetical protein FB45DRAFT_1032716 [Roridomyces roridus]